MSCADDLTFLCRCPSAPPLPPCRAPCCTSRLEWLAAVPTPAQGSKTQKSAKLKICGRGDGSKAYTVARPEPQAQGPKPPVQGASLKCKCQSCASVQAPKLPECVQV